MEYAAEKEIPVIIMEPLRGGLLTEGLPQRAKAVFAEAEKEKAAQQNGASLALESEGCIYSIIRNGVYGNSTGKCQSRADCPIR